MARASTTTITTDAGTAASEWLAAFAGLLAGAGTDVGTLFRADCRWRDHLSVTWDLHTADGLTEIAERFMSARGRAFGFQLSGRPAHQATAGVPYVEAMFRFDTSVGRGRGVVRLVADRADGVWRAWTLYTVLTELSGREERDPAHRDPAHRERATGGRSPGGDPAVLVVGAGHCGLATAARLERLGVPTLVIDAHPRVGDTWRRHYDTLALNTPAHFDHLPYRPFPPDWPRYASKDRIADWLEDYARALGLPVWTRSRLITGHFQEDGRWTVAIRRSNGLAHRLRPRHVVLATGMNSLPAIPALPGRQRYRGTVLHSSQFTGTPDRSVRRAVVIGTGTSAHDVAHDLHRHGVATTMVQRSPTYVVGRETFAGMIGGLYGPDGIPLEDADLIFASWPYGTHADGIARAITASLAETDKKMLDGLRAAGFRTSLGVGDGGLLLSHPVRAGGYHLDAGTAALIAAGRIAVAHGRIDHLTSTGVALDSGQHLPADLVVLATGFRDMRESARLLFGDDVANRCPPVHGLDHHGEVSGAWRRTGQEGLWFAAGTLQTARYHSRTLALQIAQAVDSTQP